MSHIFRSGDEVKHLPSGEEWVLAWGDRDNVSPCGWPETIGNASDCELIRAASDSEYLEMITTWSNSQSKDYRILKCRKLLSAMTTNNPTSEGRGRR